MEVEYHHKARNHHANCDCEDTKHSYTIFLSGRQLLDDMSNQALFITFSRKLLSHYYPLLHCKAANCMAEFRSGLNILTITGMIQMAGMTSCCSIQVVIRVLTQFRHMRL